MRKLGFLAIALSLVILISHCTFHRTCELQYTPFIQLKKLADKENPQIFKLYEFEDVRKSKKLYSRHLNPISVHKIQLDVSGSVTETLTNAFKDGLLKSGFVVPMEGEKETPIFEIEGKITSYHITSKTKWSNVKMTALVEVEITIKDSNGTDTVIESYGIYEIKSKGSIGWDSVAPALDKATKDCVKNFLNDEKFLNLLK